MAFTPLNALHAFLVVARRRSFAMAARDLGVSASAVSQSVQQLEARVGAALLTRTSRSVAPTDAGQRLLEHAGSGIEQALDALKNVTALPGQVTGRVKLSVPSAAVSLVLTRLVPKFVRRYPAVQLDVRVENQFEDIVAAGLDAGIRLLEAIDRDMVHVRLSSPSRLIVVGAPSYLKRKGRPEKPTDLLHHDCLCVRWKPDEEPWAWELARGKKAWRVPVRGAVVTNDRELLRSLALAGVGLLYTSEALVQDDLARGRLNALLEPYAPTVPGLFLYYPSRKQHPRLCERSSSWRGRWPTTPRERGDGAGTDPQFFLTLASRFRVFPSRADERTVTVG
jgi:DNA-binding transcriptional LysR family regulator